MLLEPLMNPWQIATRELRKQVVFLMQVEIQKQASAGKSHRSGKVDLVAMAIAIPGTGKQSNVLILREQVFVEDPGQPESSQQKQKVSVPSAQPRQGGMQGQNCQQVDSVAHQAQRCLMGPMPIIVQQIWSVDTSQIQNGNDSKLHQEIDQEIPGTSVSRRCGGIIVGAQAGVMNGMTASETEERSGDHQPDEPTGGRVP